MRNIILTIIVAFSVINLNAQKEEEKIIVEEGTIWPNSSKKGVLYQVPEVESQKFEGTWVYENENIAFKVQIKSEKTFSKSTGNYINILKGIYCYSNSEQNCEFSISTDGKNLFCESELDKLFSAKIHFRFFDDDYKKYGKVTFELLENGKAKWTLVERERGNISFDGTKTKDGFSVPTNILLTKEE
jgi:hypothetical protein